MKWHYCSHVWINKRKFYICSKALEVAQVGQKFNQGHDYHFLAFSTLSKASKYSKLNICFLNVDFIIFFFLVKAEIVFLKLIKLRPMSGVVNISFHEENSKQRSFFYI